MPSCAASLLAGGDVRSTRLGMDSSPPLTAPRAIRCACAIRDGLRALGLEIRAGLHTGECEIIGGKVGGIAVHTAARVAARAAPREVLVSGTVRDLIAGSGIELEDRGVHSLKGIPGEWPLLAVGRL